MPLILLIALAAGPYGFRQSDSPLAGTRKFSLANGLTLICREQREAPLAAFDLWIRAGSLYERREENGAAHFLEHLVFKGTKARAPGEIDAAFEDVGSELNAGTTRDAVHFHSTAAGTYLPRLLDVVADAVQNASLAPEEIVRERAVILDESARRRNEWRRAPADSLFQAVFGDTSMGRPILGTAESLNTLDRDRIKTFYSRNYRPERTILVIVGAVDPETARQAVESAFGGWIRGTPIEPPPVVTTAHTPGDGRLNTGVAGRVVAVGFPFNGRLPEREERAAAIVATLFGDERSGQLIDALRKIDKKAEVTADFSRSGAGSLLAFFARSKTITPEELSGQVQALLDHVVTDGVVENDVEWARRRLLGAFLFDIETYGGQARLLGQEEILGGYASAVDYMDSIRSVTAAQVNEFIRDHMGKDHRVTLTSKPQ